MAWSYAFSTQAGTGKNLCQDAVAIQCDHESLAIAISDGAGSATYSNSAASLVTKLAIERQGLLWSDDWQLLLGILQEGLKESASSQPIEDYSCTLVVASITPDGWRFLQVGDGGAVVLHGDSLSWLGTDPGEYM
ncbi:MAG: protein phosphatase 2C domain-containing protein, partial [Chlorobia bacterium]|nr:protein phosphatase 2C domain-containing protein [Fimbriimonadaceae bacterium]